MSAPVILSATVVADPDTGRPVFLAAGEECPDRLAGLISNPAVLAQPARRRRKDDSKEG